MLFILLGSSSCVIIVFIIGLYLSRYLNSPNLFQLISILSSISIMLIFVSLKSESSWFIHNPLLSFIMGGYSILLAFKFLELGFAFKWTYIQQMPLILVIFYLCALPRMPESEEKLLELLNQNVRQESLPSIIYGIFQFIILQTIMYLTPSQWLSLPSSLFPLTLRYLRYGLLSSILYLSINCTTNFGYGFYTLITNVRMEPVFPSFPFVSTSLRDFWSYRWNNLIKSSLHRISFIVAPKMISMNNSAKGFLAFILSGFIHEYVLWFISSKWSGRNMMFFLLHGLFVLFEITIKLPARPKTLNRKFIGWLWTAVMMLITSPLFFDPLIETGVFIDMKLNFN